MKKHRKSMPRWTAEEIELLRRHYGTMPAKQVQAQYLPDRTLKSVEMKAEKLGITAPASYERWTDDERQTLIDNIHMSTQELQAKFFPNKTYFSIAGARLRIKKPKTYPAGKTARQAKPWTKAELNALITHYGTMPIEKLRDKYIPNRSIRSIQQMAHLRNSPKKCRSYWTEEEHEIIRQNYGKIDTCEIQKRLLPHRSRSAIENQITKLGIPRKTKPGTSSFHK